MSEPDSPQTQAPRVSDSAIEAALRSAIESRGPSALFEPERLRSDLDAACPEAKVEIALTMLALDAQVPQELLAVHTENDRSSTLPRLAQRLVDRHAIEPDAARWAVFIWARALGQVIPASFAAPSAQASVAAKAGGARRRWGALAFVCAFVLVAIWVGVLALRPRTTPSAAPIAPTSEAPTRGPVVLAPEITAVDSSEPLAGDGESRDVFVFFKPNGVALRGIERRFVEGDIAWDPRPSIIELSREAIERRRALVGAIALRTTRHATATFEYVLVAADGTRSAPFEKTFTIAPGPEQTPAMTASHSPAVRGATGTPKSEHIVRAQSSRARVAPKAPVAPAAACTRTTCGSVVAVRELPSTDVPKIEGTSVKARVRLPNRKTKNYEIIIRMDDRSIRTIMQSTRWRVGAHVRMVGGKFAAI